MTRSDSGSSGSLTPTVLERDTTLGGYRVEGAIGQGGMGIVYEAVQLSLERRVALKVIAPELSRNDQFRERFRREGLSQAALDHPHVVTVYEAGEALDRLFLAMRLVRGPSLKDLIRTGEIDAQRTLRLLHPVADALDAAHDTGLIHRDVKPQNILVGSRDHAFLADFGLTQALGSQGVTRTGQFVGSLDYVSPEQIRADRATSASDVYSFGAVLFECLTGTVPFAKSSDAAVLFAHVSEPPPAVTSLRDDLPTAVNDVLHRALAKEPEERHGSAVALMDELAEALAGHTGAPAARGDSMRRESRPIELSEAGRSRSYGTIPERTAGPTVIDRAPTPSAVAELPPERRASRRPSTSAALAVAVLAATGGLGLSLLTGDAKDPAPKPARAAAPAPSTGQRAAITRLDRERVAVRRRLEAADTPANQADAAGELARTFRRASRGLEGDRATVPVRDAIDEVAGGYESLSRTAGISDAGGYRASVERVEAAEADFERALEAWSGSRR